MRPKETYTKEEYRALEEQLQRKKEQYMHVCKELEIFKSYINYVDQRDGGKTISEIQHIIAEENKKLGLRKLFIKYPFYKEVKEYVDYGITDVKQIIQLTGKSKSSVYRALHAMELLPLPKKDLRKGRLNL